MSDLHIRNGNLIKCNGYKRATSFTIPNSVTKIGNSAFQEPGIIQVYMDEADRIIRPEIKAMLLEYTKQ